MEYSEFFYILWRSHSFRVCQMVLAMELVRSKGPSPVENGTSARQILLWPVEGLRVSSPDIKCPKYLHSTSIP